MIHMDKIETLLSCRDRYEKLEAKATADYLDLMIAEELMRRDK